MRENKLDVREDASFATEEVTRLETVKRTPVEEDPDRDQEATTPEEEVAEDTEDRTQEVMTLAAEAQEVEVAEEEDMLDVLHLLIVEDRDLDLHTVEMAPDHLQEGLHQEDLEDIVVKADRPTTEKAPDHPPEVTEAIVEVAEEEAVEIEVTQDQLPEMKDQEANQ